MTGTEVHSEKIPVGISSCLLGQPVRFDGGHTRSSYCDDTLSDYFEFRAFCPEMAAGFGTPRPALRLQGDPQAPRLVVSSQPDKDVTTQLTDAFEPYLPTLTDIDGYILMRNSPSCGMERIKLYKPGSDQPKMEKTRGLFASALMTQYPYLPIEEAGRLNDAPLRENFILRVFAHHRLRHQVLLNPSFKRLLDFHSEYKYVLMAHNQPAYKALGKMLADARQAPLEEMLAAYYPRFMHALSKPASRKNNCNVLMHLLGYLKKTVDGNARQDLLNTIEQYRQGHVHLATPLTLLSHYLHLYGSDYVQMQRYLNPYPASLGLRNQV